MDKIQVVKLSVDNLLQGNISGTRAIIDGRVSVPKDGDSTKKVYR